MSVVLRVLIQSALLNPGKDVPPQTHTHTRTHTHTVRVSLNLCQTTNSGRVQTVCVQAKQQKKKIKTKPTLNPTADLSNCTFCTELLIVNANSCITI